MVMVWGGLKVWAVWGFGFETRGRRSAKRYWKCVVLF